MCTFKIYSQSRSSDFCPYFFLCPLSPLSQSSWHTFLNIPPRLSQGFLFGLITEWTNRSRGGKMRRKKKTENWLNHSSLTLFSEWEEKCRFILRWSWLSLYIHLYGRFFSLNKLRGNYGFQTLLLDQCASSLSLVFLQSNKLAAEQFCVGI